MTTIKTLVINKSTVLLFFITLIACGKVIEKKVIYHPNKGSFTTTENLSLIEIDSLNFEAVVNFVAKKNNQDSLCFVIINRKNEQNHIIVENTSFHAKRKDILSINEDSILIDNESANNKLSELMIQHYNNTNPNIYKKHRNTPKFIEIDLHENSKNLKRVLNYVLNTFVSVNQAVKDSLELRILLHRKLASPPPTPPRKD